MPATNESARSPTRRGWRPRTRSHLDGALRPPPVSLAGGKRGRMHLGLPSRMARTGDEDSLMAAGAVLRSAPALPGLTTPCQRSGRKGLHESSLMMLVAVGAHGEAGRAGPFRDRQGGTEGPGLPPVCCWALVQGGMQVSRPAPAGQQSVSRPDRSPHYRGGLSVAEAVCHAPAFLLSSPASWRRLTGVGPGRHLLVRTGGIAPGW
jgi:hypothetical protein